MPRQRKLKTVPVPYVHVPVPPEPGEPVWGSLRPMPETSSWDAWNSHKFRIPQLTEQSYVLPKFQRQWVWSIDRVIEYLQSIIDGEAQTPLVIWRPHRSKQSILLDGQHRLVSLGATVTDDTGAVRSLPTVRLNLVTMLWEPGIPDNRTSVGVGLVFCRDPLRILRDRFDIFNRSEAFQDCIYSVVERIKDLDLPTITSREPENDETWNRTADYFLRLNRSIPFTKEELQSLVKEYK